MNSKIHPINEVQQQQVVARAEYYISQASSCFKLSMRVIDIKFDLIGRSAGMYIVRNGHRAIRFNPYLFAKYFDDNLATTVPHEVAHYAVDLMYGMQNVRPHGVEWVAVMNQFKADASIRCSYDLEGIPQRRHKRHEYLCACKNYQLTSKRHNAIQKKQCSYVCKYCGHELTYKN